MHGYAGLPNGVKKDLILIKQWDFKWQGDYRYQQPIYLPRGTTLHMHFSYDNSAENIRNPNNPPRRVKYGLQTTDEMGELWLQVLPRNPAERNILAKDFYGHLAQVTINYNEYLLKENPKDAEAHTAAGRAKVFFGRIPEALRHFQAAINAQPGYDRAYYEFGYVMLQHDRLVDAERAFETVVLLNPDDYEAHGSLGVIALRNQELDKAQKHFEAALRINADDAIARANLDQVLKARQAAAGSKEQK
jgi:tetratricopeptide (TPR) repeat protein